MSLYEDDPWEAKAKGQQKGVSSWRRWTGTVVEGELATHENEKTSLVRTPRVGKRDREGECLSCSTSLQKVTMSKSRAIYVYSVWKLHLSVVVYSISWTRSTLNYYGVPWLNHCWVQPRFTILLPLCDYCKTYGTFRTVVLRVYTKVRHSPLILSTLEDT